LCKKSHCCFASCCLYKANCTLIRNNCWSWYFLSESTIWF
jgi:hypothetical protein